MGIRQSSAWKRLASLLFTHHFTLNLGVFCLIMGLSVLTNGFDASIYNNIQAMNGFQNRFGDKHDPKAGLNAIDISHLSMLNSFPMISFGVAVVVASLIGEAFGRRVIYIQMSCLCLIGVAITYTAKTYSQILAGRMIVNAYVGMESWLIPLFQAELVPTKIRGTLVSTFQLGRLIGGLIIVCVEYETANWPGGSCWKTPVSVLFVVPSLALLLTWFVPESPRRLLRKGKEEKALQSLQYIYDGDADTDRRTTIAVIAQFFGQSTGISSTHVYGTIFLKSLGTINPFTFTVISQTACILGGLVFISLIDRIGRRRFWQTSAPLAALTMMTVGALGTHENSSKNVKLGIAAICTFLLSSPTNRPILITAEIPSLKLRDKTAMMGWNIQNLTSSIATFAVPYFINTDYGKLHFKVSFIYRSIGLLGLKSRSLEEVDVMLRERVPARRTKDWTMHPDRASLQLTKLEAHQCINKLATDDDDEKDRDVVVHTESAEKRV
ncbi:MFS general substrate transporter [Zopfia rhizophila CBS 207.26]|uniref:MFS general substrate transporter n=1 Tax=Zopfia rhizophila CBS 207.26 TaxID=1314779 RepID=A0A6A6EKZ8_9PEZI|nr:MFS general substrate transporter [Zopfia rhizophila CBS 207.26]